MSTTTIQSPGAIALGAVLAAGTFAILFWDVRAVGDITTDHIATAAMLIVAIAAGHWFMPTLRRGRVLPAIGLAILFSVATFACVAGSAGRGAEISATKAAEAGKINEDRKDAKEQLEAARAKREGLSDALAKECGSGKGARCKGLREALEAQESHVALLQARVERLQPAQEANVRLKHAARVFAFFRPGSDVKRIEEGLELTWPFALALVMELGTIVLLGLGFGHRSTKSTGRTDSASPNGGEPAELSEPKRPNRGPMSKVEAERFVVTQLALRKRLPSQDWLAKQCGVSKSTAHDWLGEWERGGLIRRGRVGKCNIIEAA